MESNEFFTYLTYY